MFWERYIIPGRRIRRTYQSQPMDSVIQVYLLIPILFVVYHLLRPRPPLPPGPTGLPFIGSLLDIIRDKSPKPQYLKYLEMGKAYNSDIVHVKVFGDHTVILNSIKATNELLEKRSSIYSGRPPMPMVVDLCRWTWNLGLMPYSNFWRSHRRTFSQYFRSKYVHKYHPIQRKEILRLLMNLLDEPTNFREHVRGYTGAISLRITHGIESEEDKKYYVELSNHAIQAFVHAGTRGTFLVDYFPWLKYVPAWLPGASFKRKANVWAKSSCELNDLPWDKVKSSLANGTVTPCIATQGLEQFKSRINEMEEIIKNVCGVAYAAGTDTTVSLLLSAILAMVCHPDVQKQAHAELDAVVGTDRLPDFSDHEKLPYIECILKETQRMWPSLPMNIEHYSINDDIYEGYFIPKGTTVIGNAWAILHDEATYDDPMTFKPERFLKEEGKQLPPDPTLSFGFGRRICPGRYFAHDNAWLMIACILTVFTVEKALDVDGKEIEVKMEHNHGALIYPLPFQCRFTPRSPQTLNLLNTGFAGQEVADI